MNHSSFIEARRHLEFLNTSCRLWSLLDRHTFQQKWSPWPSPQDFRVLVISTGLEFFRIHDICVFVLLERLDSVTDFVFFVSTTRPRDLGMNYSSTSPFWIIEYRTHLDFFDELVCLRWILGECNQWHWAFGTTGRNLQARLIFCWVVVHIAIITGSKNTKFISIKDWIEYFLIKFYTEQN